MSRKYLVILLAVAFVVGAFGNVFASSSYLGDFSSTYPSSNSDSFSCSLCHVPAGPSARNPYGAAWRSASYNFRTIESQDSDGDGSTNIVEINAGTNPGDANSRPATPPPPATCSSFTYSAWGACQSNNTQTRTVVSSLPAGCTGGSPILSQACTYVPPVTACTSFTYSAWSACQSNNTQIRTVVSKLPAGCTGNPPASQLTQACTYVPPVTACTSFTYSAWGACQSNNTQSRTVTSSLPAGCTGGSPVLSQACTYVPPVTACTSFTYSAWGACQSNNTQSRTVTSSLPAGCTGGSPVLSQACTFVPPVTPPPTGTMPLPTDQEKFEYTAVANPVVSADPAAAKPIGVGPLAEGGRTIDLKVNVGPFAKPMNVSFFIYAPAVDSEDLYYMDRNREMKKLTNTVGELERASFTSRHGDDSTPSYKKFRKLAFWKTDVTSVNERVYRGSLAPGYYALTLIAKSDDGDDDDAAYYSWTTHVLVPGDRDRDRDRDDD